MCRPSVSLSQRSRLLRVVVRLECVLHFTAANSQVFAGDVAVGAEV